MDVSFYCEKCGQHILIDPTGAGSEVPCPNCGIGLIVPRQSVLPRAAPPRQPASLASMPAWTSANTKLTRNPVKILLAVGIVAIVILAAGALGTRLWYRQKQAQVEAEQAVKQKAEQEIATQLKTDLGKAKQEIISLQEKLNDIERQKAEQAKADIHLDGEVFIATKGGESVKLGLVPIALFSISKLLACLSNEQAIAIKEIARLTSEEKADEVQQNGDPYGWLKFYLREKIVAEHNKILIYMGEGQHKIKRKAEQVSCEEAIKAISIF